MSRVLVVDDSEVLRVSVASALRTQGHETQTLPDGNGFESALVRYQPDLVILDIMLPGRDGFELLAGIRRLTQAGVIMLTAIDDLERRVTALTRGADDYLQKPFAMSELQARVGAVLRRIGRQGASITVGDLVMADEAASVTRDGVVIELTETERRLLAQLARTPERVVTKTQLLTGVWGYEGYDENIVEVHISSLRRRLEADGSPRVIHTIRGRGYRLGLV